MFGTLETVHIQARPLPCGQANIASRDPLSGDLQKTVFMTSPKIRSPEVIGRQKRRSWTAEQKVAMVRECLEPGAAVSSIARRHAVDPNQLFRWRKEYFGGLLSSFPPRASLVPAAELADALRQIGELQRMLGKKTMEAESLREALERLKSRTSLRRLSAGDNE